MTTFTSTYEIHLAIYQGPLDLLLELIERAELDITSIALAKVTDQYLEYMRRLPEQNLEDLSWFLIIAARLLQIKSEALLPRPRHREPGEIDPGEALAGQLRVYKRFKEVAEFLMERDEAGLRTYLRLAPPPVIEPTLDLNGVSLEDLQQAMLTVLAAEPDGTRIEEVIAAERIRLRDKISHIVSTLRDLGRTSFRDLVRKAKSRLEIVVSFLALLELIKQRQVVALQDKPFADIQLMPGEAWTGEDEINFDLEFEE